MVPPGIPGRSDARLPAGLRPGRGPPAAGRGRLSGRRGLPGDHPDDVRWRTSTRRSSTRSSGSSASTLELRDDGRRLLRSPGSGAAADVVPRLGRRLPGPQRLPRRPAGQRRHPTTTAAGARRSSTRRSPRPARPPIPTPRRAAYDRAETIVQDEVPVVPLVYGTGWALSRTSLLGADAERARGRAHGGPGVGGVRTTAGRAGRIAARLAGFAAVASLGLASAPRAAGRGPGGLRRADGRLVVHRGRGLPPARDPRSARGPGRAAADHRREVGTTVIPVDGPTGTGAADLTYHFDPAVDGHIVPNTRMVARWRLVSATTRRMCRSGRSWS